MWTNANFNGAKFLVIAASSPYQVLENGIWSLLMMFWIIDPFRIIDTLIGCWLCSNELLMWLLVFCKSKNLSEFIYMLWRNHGNGERWFYLLILLQHPEPLYDKKYENDHDWWYHDDLCENFYRIIDIIPALWCRLEHLHRTLKHGYWYDTLVHVLQKNVDFCIWSCWRKRIWV